MRNHKKREKKLKRFDECKGKKGKFEPLRVSNEQQLKCENEKIIHCTRMVNTHCREITPEYNAGANWTINMIMHNNQ